MLWIYLAILETQEDKEKFTALYNKYKGFMMKIAVHYVHNYDIAEEAVHDAFTDIAKYFVKVEDVESTKTKKYVSVVTKTCAFKAYKAEKRNKSTLYENSEEVELEIVAPETTDEARTIHEKAEYIMSCIDKLDEHSALMLTLRYLYDYDYKHIASLIGEKEATCRKRVERSIAKLREMKKNEF